MSEEIDPALRASVNESLQAGLADEAESMTDQLEYRQLAQHFKELLGSILGHELPENERRVLGHLADYLKGLEAQSLDKLMVLPLEAVIDSALSSLDEPELDLKFVDLLFTIDTALEEPQADTKKELQARILTSSLHPALKAAYSAGVAAMLPEQEGIDNSPEGLLEAEAYIAQKRRNEQHELLKDKAATEYVEMHAAEWQDLEHWRSIKNMIIYLAAGGLDYMDGPQTLDELVTMTAEARGNAMSDAAVRAMAQAALQFVQNYPYESHEDDRR